MSWQRELLDTLAKSWPCRRCALPESHHRHRDDELPDWVPPHDYERAPHPKAVATIEVVDPPSAPPTGS